MITSTSNAQVKQLIQLQKKRKERDSQDVFIVEGIKMYREVPKDHLIQTYVSESFYHKNRSLFNEKLPKDSKQSEVSGADERIEDLTILSDRIFESVSDTKTPQGILCLVRQYHYRLEDLLTGSPLVMILENIQDPGNLGTILRTAEGAGVTGILLSGDCVDIYNPKVIRSTMGSVYRMPFYYAQDWQEDLKWLKRHGVRIYAAHLNGADFYDRQDYCGASAFLIGNESRGLTEETASFADTLIKIPMCGHVESLNAAVASSVLMYEANRQRRSK